MKTALPRLLDGNFREKARLSPCSLALELKLFGLSTAEMLLPDSIDIAPRDLVELYDEGGSAGIFRVDRIRQDAGQTRRVFLTHSLCTLGDSVTGAWSWAGSVRGALEQLLSLQAEPRWVLGDVALPEDTSLLYSTDCTDLLSALEEMLALLPQGYALGFTQSGSLWVLHLQALPEGISCEGRLGRNLRSVRITSDGSRLCTRVYPYGAKADQQRLSLLPDQGVEYLQSGAAAELGVIASTFASDRIFDVPTLRSVAELYLERHSRPETTLQVEAADLSAITAQPLDAFRLGHLCRLALPGEGMTLTARITAMHKPDVLGAPGQVTLTLEDAPLRARDEITALINQVTAARMLGGSLVTTHLDNRAEGSYPSPIVHYFDVPDGSALLDCRVAFTPDPGVSVTELRVDDTYPAKGVWSGGSFSAMAFLKRDALGCIASGTHRLILHPHTGIYGELGAVVSRVTLTTLEQP